MLNYFESQWLHFCISCNSLILCRLWIIITSSNGNIFRVTRRLCREFTGHGWVNNGEAGDSRRHRAHYDVTVMQLQSFYGNKTIKQTPISLTILKFKVYGSFILSVIILMNWSVLHMTVVLPCRVQTHEAIPYARMLLRSNKFPAK